MLLLKKMQFSFSMVCSLYLKVADVIFALPPVTKSADKESQIFSTDGIDIFTDSGYSALSFRQGYPLVFMQDVGAL